MFDGSTSTFAQSTNGGQLTFTPATAIPYTAASGGVEVNFAASSQADRVRINGGSWYNQTTVNVGGWETVSTGDGSITKMEFQDQSSNEATIRAIRVNGTILTDPSGANDWTVNNLTASGLGNTPGVTTQVPDDVTGDWLGILGITPTNTNGTFATIPDGGGPTLPDKGKFYWSGLTVGDTITLYGTGSGSNRSVTGDVSEASSPGYVAVPGASLGSFTVTVTAASGSCKVDHNGAFTCYGITPGPLASRYFDDGVDSPTNGDTEDDTGVGGEVSGNYCTFNPLYELTGGYNFALSEGNLEATNGGDAPGTMAFGSGKKYFELTVKSASSFSQGFYGIVNIADHIRPRAWATSQIAALRDSGSLYGDGSTGSAPAATQVGDVYGFAVDVDNQKLFISVNGTYLNSADPASGTGASFTGRDFSNYAPLASIVAGNSQTIVLNAGQRPFNTAAPSGFKALCTANLPDVTDGSAHFDTKIWQGTGSTLSITGYKFSPDLVWIKKRSGTSDHALFDTIRGATKRLYPNDSSGEDTLTDNLTAFNSDGFSLGNANDVNQSSQTYAAWAWKAGDSNTPVSAGSLNSSVYNQDQTWASYGTYDNRYNSSSYTWSGVFNTDNNYTGTGSLYVNNSSLGDKWVLSSSVAVTSSVKLYVYSTITLTINHGLSDETTANLGATNQFRFVEVSFSGNVSSVRIQSSGAYIMGIWFDGLRLVDAAGIANVPSIASTYRANPSAGFSIVTWTGTGSAGTLAHGLQKKPELIITKVHGDSTYADNWPVYHSAYGAGTYTYLNDTRAAPASYTDFFDGVEPTSSVFSVGSDNSDNTKNLIAYCFSPVAGYSAFGSYTGNGSTDGVFVHTNFRPAFIVVKRTNGAGNWHAFDTKRDADNRAENGIYWNLSSAETVVYFADINSNGFKLRTSNAELNGSGDTYIYLAFAEHPFQANGGLAR